MSEANKRARIEYLQSIYQAKDVQAMTLRTNLIVCLDMLREAGSPYVPSSGSDNEWLARRDRVVENADRALSADGNMPNPAQPIEAP
jgi:hypothetical protein